MFAEKKRDLEPLFDGYLMASTKCIFTLSEIRIQAGGFCKDEKGDFLYQMRVFKSKIMGDIRLLKFLSRGRIGLQREEEGINWPREVLVRLLISYLSFSFFYFYLPNVHFLLWYLRSFSFYQSL